MSGGTSSIQSVKLSVVAARLAKTWATAFPWRRTCAKLANDKPVAKNLTS